MIANSLPIPFALLNPAPLDRLDYVVVGGYLAAMLALGAALSSRIRAFKDYFLAGGALTTPLLICTLVSSYYGIEAMFGTSESGFYYGVAAWFWFSLPFYVCITFAALVIAPRLRRYQGAMTLSDILEQHYGMPTRVVGAVACFLYSAPIIAMASMMTLMEFLGIPTMWGLLATIGICATYTMLGGLWADAISDTMQFVLMCVSLAIAIPFAVEWIGGWSFVERMTASSETADHFSHHGGRSGWMLAAWTMTCLTVLVEPAFYQRTFAAADTRSVQRALLTGILLWASYDWGVTLIGIIARSAVDQGLLPGDLEGKSALLAVCMEMLPTGLRGLMIGGILAAAMSMIDSYSLLASGNVVYDVYRPAFNPRASDRRLLVMTRLGVFGVMVASALISLLFDRMRDTWQFMSGIMASVVLVPVLGAFFSRPKPAAGLCGAVGGFLGLITFYGLLFTLGEFDPEEETYVWRVGGTELWQDFAVLLALPVSIAGFVAGNLLGKKEETR